MVQLGEHFGSDSRSVQSEQLQRKRWFIKARQDRQLREILEDRADENLTAFASAAVMATKTEIQKFEAKLDVYDEATVKALMLNQKQLDAVNIQINALLDRAHVMEDGRRVFRTEDGSQAFDESGKEVTRDELDFAAIDPSSPTWENYQPIFIEQNRLVAERKGILEFQEKVDSARDKIAEGDISKADLDGLDADLAESMPPSVKAHVPGFDTADNAPVAKTAFKATANPVIPVSPTSPTTEPHLQL